MHRFLRLDQRPAHLDVPDKFFGLARKRSIAELIRYTERLLQIGARTVERLVAELE